VSALPEANAAMERTPSIRAPCASTSSLTSAAHRCRRRRREQRAVGPTSREMCAAFALAVALRSTAFASTRSSIGTVWG
jgi:hypothetical protein